MSDIWSDPEVHRIFIVQDGEPKLKIGELGDEDRRLMQRFIAADQRVDNFATADVIVEACVAGVLSRWRGSRSAAVTFTPELVPQMS